MEKDKEEILREAKKIIDKFHNALANVEKLKETKVERDECERQEDGEIVSDSEFREIMFQNAPEQDGECIKAEKGKWIN